MLFEKNKAIFVHIPKTGGSSLEYAICSNLLKTDINVEEKAYESFSIRGGKMGIQKLTPKGHTHSYISEYSQFVDLGDYLKFCVLRNPFDQVRSLYNQMKKPMSIPSLEHFIMADDQRSMRILDHYIDQHKYTHINDQLFIDKVFTFDRYAEAQYFVENYFNIQIDRNKKLWPTKYTSEIFTPEMTEKFKSVYYKSIELYNRFSSSRI